MNAPEYATNEIEQQLSTAMAAQRDAYLAEGVVSAAARIDRIDRAIDVLLRYADALSDALNTDFSCRPSEITLLTDVAGSITP